MAFVQLNPGAMLAPVPVVMVSCKGREGKPNIITVAWAGTCCTQPPMVALGIRPERFSRALIEESGEFVVNLVGKNLMETTDWCGVKSGRDVDKFAERHLTPVTVPEMQYAPAIGECPIYLGCKVKNITPLGTHDLVLGEIIKVGVQESLMDENGSIDYNKAELICYNHGAYYGLTEALGFFGYSVAAPDVRARRMNMLKKEK